MRALPRRVNRGSRADEVEAALDSWQDVLALHDRRMIGATGRPAGATIDHLVIAPSGVWALDTKTHYGHPEVRRSGGILTPRVERLFINNRDRTSLVEGLHRQVAAVDRVLVEAGHDVPVRGALYFVGTTLPWASEEIAGIPLVGRRGLETLVLQSGDLSPDERGAVGSLLGSRFASA